MTTLELDTSPPTVAEIDAAIEDILAVEAGAPCRVDLDCCWECHAFDQNGELQGVGYDVTPAAAKGTAWITACGWLETVPTEQLRTIPRTVPAGWAFEVYPPEAQAWTRTNLL